MGIVTIIASRLSGIPISVLVVLALALAPLGVLRMCLHNAQGSGSIFFGQHIMLFRLLSMALGAALLGGLFFYGRKHGFGNTVIYFLIAAIIQAPYYAVLKSLAQGEIFLIPCGVLGLASFYYFAVF